MRSGLTGGTEWLEDLTDDGVGRREALTYHKAALELKKAYL